MRLSITIPADLEFAALQLGRDAITGEVSFAWTAIERICEASGIAAEVFKAGHEDNVAGLIVEWYWRHLAQGGERDAVADQLLAEVVAEDEHGAHRVQRGPVEPQ